jgi:hypothetical protein
MEIFTKARVRNGLMAALAALALGSTLAPSAAAKNKATDRVTVVAHLALPGTSVSQMLLQQRGGRQYLSIQQTSQPGTIVIDVTRADRPDVVSDAALGTPSERLEMIGSGLALSEIPDSKPGSSRHALTPVAAQTKGANGRNTESVRVLDLSDPKNPKTLQAFSGVTSVLADDKRKLIYIANGEGLWILRHVDNPELPLCDSESVFSPIVDCQ